MSQELQYIDLRQRGQGSIWKRDPHHFCTWKGASHDAVASVNVDNRVDTVVEGRTMSTFHSPCARQ